VVEQARWDPSKSGEETWFGFENRRNFTKIINDDLSVLPLIHIMEPNVYKNVVNYHGVLFYAYYVFKAI
jgi:hypothetical protein